MAATQRAHSGANPARIYDALLGGKNNYAADVKAAKALVAAKPDLPGNVRANRAFLARAVRYLAGEAGIRQFLDIGAGLPTMDNTHEVAQRARPDARVVYADNDPEVLATGQAPLTSTAEGSADFIQADLRDPERILSLTAGILDLSQPVAILLLGILYLLPDSDDPRAIIASLTSAAPPGSYLAISHPASDIHAAEAARGARIYARRTGIPQTNRTREDVARLLGPLEPVEPGVVQLNHWRPQPGDDTEASISSWAAVAYKP
jgi:O-methyltransferase involved in polyketide biosynthesis